MSLITWPAEAARLPAPASSPAAHRVAVRNTTTADACAVSDVYNEGRPVCSAIATPQPQGLDSPISMDMATRWIALHQQSSRPLWLASVQGTPVAWLSFFGFVERPGCAGTAELGIHVRESWRGRGIGSQLVARAISGAPGLGFDRLVACIRDDNPASLALFHAHDFESWGRYPGVVRGLEGRRDLLILGLEVSSARHWHA